jgi:hypothetical protein
MTELKKASEPFKFYTRLHLQELTGLKARTLKEMVNILRKVPGSVVYYHTHHFLQQHQYLSPEPPNDFAYWTGNVLGEKLLAEELAAVDTMEFATIRALREKIIATIKRHLEKHRRLRSALEGQEFYFIKSISFILPTPHVAWTLPEFVEILKDITIRSLYFHIFEARLRLEKGKNDFSNWIENSLQDKKLAQAIARLDPYTHTMEGLRQTLVTLIQERIKEIKNA